MCVVACDLILIWLGSFGFCCSLCPSAPWYHGRHLRKSCVRRVGALNRLRGQISKKFKMMPAQLLPSSPTFSQPTSLKPNITKTLFKKKTLNNWITKLELFLGFLSYFNQFGKYIDSFNMLKHVYETNQISKNHKIQKTFFKFSKNIFICFYCVFEFLKIFCL